MPVSMTRLAWLAILCCVVITQTSNAFSIDPNEKIYQDTESCGPAGANIWPPTMNKSGSVLLCLMYKCSLVDADLESGARTEVPAHCQWWRKLTGKINIGQEMQDLKNYMALKELEKAKYEAIKIAEPTPQAGEQIYSGLKMSLLESSVRDEILCHNQAFASAQFGEFGAKFLSSTGCANFQNSVGAEYVIKHLQDFCSKEEENKGLCKHRPYCFSRNNKRVCMDVEVPYDLMGSSLTRYSTFPSTVVAEGAKRYVENLMAAATPEKIDPTKIFNNPEEAKRGEKFSFKTGAAGALAGRYYNMALLSMINHSLMKMVSIRRPALDDQNAGFVGKSANKSLLGTIEVESRRRFTDPQWYASINNLSETALLREMANMYAMQLMLNYKVKEHLEKIEALMAVRNSYVTDQIVGGIEKARSTAEDFLE